MEQKVPGFTGAASLNRGVGQWVGGVRQSHELTSGSVLPASPGHCECSSVLGIGCSVTGNHCNEGFTPSCE
jgi:hypothetical protein